MQIYSYVEGKIQYKNHEDLKEIIKTRKTLTKMFPLGSLNE